MVEESRRDTGAATGTSSISLSLSQWNVKVGIAAALVRACRVGKAGLHWWESKFAGMMWEMRQMR